jgi:hypothetical protein
VVLASILAGVSKSDYKDKKEYFPEEVLEHEMENLPDDMKTYWRLGGKNKMQSIDLSL